MKYQKGMKRYRKAGGKYEEDDNGPFYQGTDKKMYKMAAPTLEGTTKSEVTVDDFQKSLDQLEEIAKADDPESRKKELLSKAQSGEELSVDERDELYKALGNEDTAVEDDPDIVKSVQDAMAPADNEPLQKALDVSEYLEAQHDAITASLSELAKAMDSSDQRQHEFNLVFAKAFHQVGELVKGMSERLGVIEHQPARAPKSKGIPANSAPEVVQKSFAGGEGAPPEGQLSKSEILDGLEGLMKSCNGTAACGEDIVHATAKYESCNEISKAMLAEVTDFAKSQAH